MPSSKKPASFEQVDGAKHVLFIYFFAAHAATLIVGNNVEFARIQDAVDAAKPGDSVEVINGTYVENVTIEKPITLRGIGKPVVDAMDSYSSIALSQNRDMFPLISYHGIVMIS